MENKSGFLIINKPVGPTSHDIIDKLRRITGIKKIGHAGTLDPFASGVLIVAVGREATREISRFVKLNKEYIATMHLGATSNTYDRTGKIVPVTEFNSGYPELNSVEEVLKKYTGKQKQVPPMYSAKKVKGKKLYELARKGVEIERQPEDINIYKIKLMDYKYPLLKIKIASSTGTYVRSLAHDIGQELGSGAYLEELERTAVGEYKLEQAMAVKDLTGDNWQASFIDIF